MSVDAEDRIHPATPARIEQARGDGDFAKSFELAAAVQMLGALAVAWLLFGTLADWMKNATVQIWDTSVASQIEPQHLITINPTQFNQQIRGLIFSALGVLVPIGALLVGFGVLAHWCQTGPVFLSNKVTPDVSRLALGSWFSRLFSASTLSQPLIGLPKPLLALGVMGISCWCQRGSFFELGRMPVDNMVDSIFQLVLMVCAHVTLALLLASVVDYAMKYLSFQNRIRMTDQQLRDEARMQNGNGNRLR